MPGQLWEPPTCMGAVSCWSGPKPMTASTICVRRPPSSTMKMHRLLSDRVLLAVHACMMQTIRVGENSQQSQLLTSSSITALQEPIYFASLHAIDRIRIRFQEQEVAQWRVTYSINGLKQHAPSIISYLTTGKLHSLSSRWRQRHLCTLLLRTKWRESSAPAAYVISLHSYLNNHCCVHVAFLIKRSAMQSVFTDHGLSLNHLRSLLDCS